MNEITGPQDELEKWVRNMAPPHVDNKVVYNPVSEDDQEGRLLVRDKIEAFQSALQEIAGDDRGEMDAINDNGLSEYMVGGAYIRELFIPKGMFMCSRIWKKPRFWIIAEGEVTFTTEMGTQRVRAPYRMEVSPGSKVALFTHEDTLWFAITGCKTETKDGLESELTTMNYGDCKYPWCADGGDV